MGGEAWRDELKLSDSSGGESSKSGGRGGSVITRRPLRELVTEECIRDASRTGRILLSSGAALDHPVHPGLPETAYLKALTLQLD